MKKIETLRSLMSSNDWKKAISLASKFPRLGKIRNDVLDAQLAFTNPNFVKQIKKDPDMLIKAGINALLNEYGI